MDLPEVAASGRASVCLVGVQMALRTRGACLPAETAGLPGSPRAGNPPVPTWVAPRPPGVNLLICWEGFQNPPPASVCSGLESSETETSRTPGPASLRGILPGFTFYGEVLEGWAERSLESGQGGRRGEPPPFLLLPGSHSRPAPAARDQFRIPGKHVGRRAGVA